MKAIVFFLFFGFSVQADTFESDAKLLAKSLREGIMQKLSQKISEKGTPNAVEFCHENIGPIAKDAAGSYIQKYEFGRTSHKWRNEKNIPKPWMESYVSKYRGKFKSEIQEGSLIHKLNNGKRVYFEPLFIQPLCLQCHGENIPPQVKEKISSLYPKDNATGFKVGEFRGFIWVKEK